ncbi:hypothetical protein CTI12_AA181420 [Artemisia annua]|uniref:Uncharacterized protein n=1 Tax=Artemisia annua TaxID=35608 RepID=A0A2U1P898_ARTAN|nr:hypothetical protein CTI12_AA181420 [Artemisia annua]
MDFRAPETKEPITTPPKLLLFSLHSKKPTLPDGLTPPPFATAAVPFLWEEAPGKPRLTKADDPPKSKIVRSLDLPPRLITTTMSPINDGKDSNKLGNNDGIEIIPSPTTVLDGPYEGTYVSIPYVRSQEKVVASSNNNSTKTKGKVRMPLKKLMRKEKSPVKFSSWRWDSFRDIDGGKVVGSKSLKFCSWRWDSFRDSGRGVNVRGGGSICSSVDDLESSFDSGGKNGKVTRRSSFTFGNGITSGFLANMYGTLKQVIPWRSRR